MKMKLKEREALHGMLRKSGRQIGSKDKNKVEYIHSSVQKHIGPRIFISSPRGVYLFLLLLSLMH